MREVGLESDALVQFLICSWSRRQWRQQSMTDGKFLIGRSRDDLVSQVDEVVGFMTPHLGLPIGGV